MKLLTISDSDSFTVIETGNNEQCLELAKKLIRDRFFAGYGIEDLCPNKQWDIVYNDRVHCKSRSQILQIVG